jgi:hypothetical protein
MNGIDNDSAYSFRRMDKGQFQEALRSAQQRDSRSRPCLEAVALTCASV